MLFNSVEFLYFFIVVTTLFFLIPHKLRWFLLLAASCYFYMYFKPIYILILIFTIIIDYTAGILIENEQYKNKKRIYLIASLIGNIGVLAVFKYYNFINFNLSFLLGRFDLTNPIPFLSILLPIGLSFHTFQAMSYTIEVYRGNQKAERHFGIYSLYVMFYPQLVAGPIERPQNIIHQLHEKKYFTYQNAITGLNLMALGLFKKIVIADRLSIYVNQVYGNIENASTISTLLAVIFFSFQIYCDFSGYSDIARGAAKFMGFDLMINFNRPYLAQSIGEFWARWHISLSTWFRDYLYIPLGGNRTTKAKWLRNLTIVFLLSGLWHGANWTFIVWGGLHAVYLIFGTLTAAFRNKYFPSLGKLNKISNQIVVFVLVSFAWIFFRAETFSKATLIIKKIGSLDFSINLTQIAAGNGPLNLILTFISLFLLAFISPPKRNGSPYKNVIFLLIITFLILILGKNDKANFIYFQF